MISYPKITIVTPSFNQAQYIEKTIESILSQNYPNLEYIIIDGGSTDNSVEIIKKFRKHLAYWISETDSGQSDAINKGIKIASGEIINWLNSDDYYEQGALKIVSEYFQDPATKVVCGRSRKFDSSGIKKNSKGTDIYRENLVKTIGWARIDQPETFFRLESWKKTGLLNTQMHYLMDREWWIRYLFLSGLDGIVETNEILVNFRLHEHSKTISRPDEFQVDHDTIFYGICMKYNFFDIAHLIRSQCEVDKNYHFPGMGNMNKFFVKQIMHYYLLKRADEFYYQGKNKKADCFIKAIDIHLLTQEDKRLYRKINLRNSLIPSFILNFIRIVR